MVGRRFAGRDGAVFGRAFVAGCLLWFAASTSTFASTAEADAALQVAVDEYVERYFDMWPTRALAAGRFDRAAELENLTFQRRSDWMIYNLETAKRLRADLASGRLGYEARLDAELLLRQADLEAWEFEIQKLPQQQPLFWSRLIGNATVFLLVREDRPVDDRLAAAIERARLLPRLAGQAADALRAGDPKKLAKEHLETAARQVHGAADYYRDGFAAAATNPEQAKLMEEVGASAAEALDRFAMFLDFTGRVARGTPRLGKLWQERFARSTGLGLSAEQLLDRAEKDLQAKRVETAEYGRSVWKEIFGERPMPEADLDVVQALFERVAADHASDGDAFIEQYRRLVAEAIEFVEERDLLPMPEPFEIFIDRSPAYLAGQSVGGVYPPGPWAPEAPTLLFLPTPPADADEQALAGFFRDFNDHFNRMITPHEIVPGHALQLVEAARHPRRVRALFADGVYVEGWGTFCERLMLDLGWGDPLDRLAHLKKQLENIARTIVDVRVHTEGMEREEVLRFVREEALQDEQFAANMWMRALTSSPQLTTYYLGYAEVDAIYRAARAARGEKFSVREFLGGMMTLGPVPVRHYRPLLISGSASGN